MPRCKSLGLTISTPFRPFGAYELHLLITKRSINLTHKRIAGAGVALALNRVATCGEKCLFVRRFQSFFRAKATSGRSFADR